MSSKVSAVTLPRVPTSTRLANDVWRPSQHRPRLRSTRWPTIVMSAKRSEAEATQLEESSRASYPNLVTVLLQRAASRMERGETFCLHCQGEGVTACHTCKGAGVLNPARVKVSTMNQVVSQIKQTFGQGSPFDFKITNRCRTCHGTGVEKCTRCGGKGRHGRV
mmetsp:Transcript_13025/g.36638  ORF Transcript_13025/g.36638 Transcript_13025/m.36638 type:complete len:164 (+) Transcript_13025:440-931(+)